MGDGLSATAGGVTMTSSVSTLPAGASSSSYQFQIMNGDNTVITAFRPDQTKLMHFYLIRSDANQFQHVHPVMATDGTWTATLAGLMPGEYRAYSSFILAGGSDPIVVSKTFVVAGAMESMAPVAVNPTATVDGYTVTAAGDVMAGSEHQLTATITKDGKPVKDLEPYLDTYAHLSAFNTSTLAFAHLHPQGKATTDHGGPTLTFHALFPSSGTWKVFIQFQTGGVLHTAPITLAVK